MEEDGESEFLEPGRYVACVRAWGDAPGDDDGMNLSETGGPTEAPVTFNVDMNKHILSGEFNPGTDNVDVAGTFNDWSGSELMVDEDGDGIYTISVDNQTIGRTLEFKYRINSNWDTSEFPLEGKNRTYSVRYWNILDHVYNGGETVGIEEINLGLKSLVYANPSSGKFSIKVESDQLDNFGIVISDIQGRVLYTKELSSTYSYKETIDLQLEGGVYFVTLSSSKGHKTHKLIIK